MQFSEVILTPIVPWALKLAELSVRILLKSRLRMISQGV